MAKQPPKRGKGVESSAKNPRERQGGNHSARLRDHRDGPPAQSVKEDKRERGKGVDGGRSSRNHDERDSSKSPKRHTRRSVPRARSPPKAPRSMQERDQVTREHIDPSSQTKLTGDTSDRMEVDRVPEELDGDELNREMLRVMGFAKFKTTKQTPVAGNKGAYGVSVDKKTRYRQYMNRRGGFNRPLSPS